MPEVLDELLMQTQAPREFFSPAMVAAARRATEVVEWAGQAADRPARIRAALERVSPLLVAAAELLKWQRWCYREFRRVPLVGFENRERVYLDLDDVFVPLRVSPTPSPRGEGRVGVDKRGVKGAEALAPEAQADVEARELTIFEALQETERARAKNPALAGLALIDDPGAGKTTLLRHVYCRVMREGSATVGLPQGLVPVLMRFSRLESIERRPRALADALRKEAEANGYAGAAEPLLASDRRLLVLLDGLDEVRDEATRVELSQWLEREIEHWDGRRFVATCRAEAWRREQLASNRFLDARIQWLDDDAVREYVRRWFQAVVRGQDYLRESADVLERRASERAEALLKVVLGAEFVVQYRLRELRSNPLLLSTLCLVHQSGHKLPRQRGELYNRCIALLLEAWQVTKDEEAKATGARVEADAGPRYLPNESARVVLQPLAWAMQVSGERSIGGEALREVIREPLRRARKDELDLSPDEFVRLARERCGVLVSRDLDRYEFFHLSFQEYLAAAHARTEGLLPELATRAGDPRWHEVILLAVSVPGVMRAFAAALLACGHVAAYEELLESCLREAPKLDHEPFTQAIARASLRFPTALVDRVRNGRVLDVASLATLMRLLQGRDEPQFWEAAGRLRHHRDPGLSALALQGGAQGDPR